MGIHPENNGHDDGNSDKHTTVEELVHAVDELKGLLKRQEAHATALEAEAVSLETIFNRTPLGMCITDEYGFFEKVNPAYCRFYGYTEEELIGEHFTLVVPGEMKVQLAELHDAFIAGKEEIRGEWEVQKRDGSLCTILGDACRIYGGDGRPRKVTFVMDISDRKRAEKLRQDIDRITTHDLKNPLSGVLSFPEVLLDEGGNLTAEQRDMIETIRDSGLHVLQMINRTLDRYKMEEGRYKLNPESFDALPLLHTVARELAGLWQERQIGFSVWVNEQPQSEGASFPLWAERLLIRSLLSNLLRNAFEASQPGDEVQVHFHKRNGMNEMVVRNQAVVPDDMRDHFFEEFRTSGKDGGTGLGTYSAKLIAETHGGNIRLSSREREGTAVAVCLPEGPV